MMKDPEVIADAFNSILFSDNYQKSKLVSGIER
jgi:hypothetical protein